MKTSPANDAKSLSKHDEDRLIEAGRSAFSTSFPNPNREGCPESSVIKDIALRKASAAQSREFMVHMSQCSPCFNEYGEFREQAKGQQRFRMLAVAAAVVLVVGIGAWAWLSSWRLHSTQGGNIATQNTGTYQQALVDLRGREALRGAEQHSNAAPVELPRAPLALSIYLPTGSEPANYEVEIVKRPGSPLVGGKGSAQLRDHIAVIEIKLDLSPLHPGLYRLAIRQTERSWTYYPVLLR